MRANLCERLCRLCGGGEPDTAYTVGLLSVLDAMMSQPLDDVIDELPLPDEVKRAIVAHEGFYGNVLDSTKLLERNQWPGLDCPNLSTADVVEAYAESSALAFTTMELLDKR